MIPAEENPFSILGDIDVNEFLKEYWQKKPLLVRQAIPSFVSPLDAEELAGLACEENVEARLVQQKDGQYSLRQGPFTTRDFAKLPARDWTLLVQDVEKHLPEFAAWLDHFDFIPHWRVDDLMISHAAEGGGVGPHTDAYDVFLLQAKGRRRWSIAERFNPATIPGIDVKVLKEFRSEQEWELEPGDMLYLPPNVAHEGVALDGNCMTWSIGFRAPSLRDMFLDFSEWLYQQLPEDAMYSDADLAPWESGNGKISPTAFARMRKLLRSAIENNDDTLDRWFGQFMTEPKPWLQSEASEDTPSGRNFVSRLRAGDVLLRDSRALLAWSPFSDGAVLFVNGDAWNVHKRLEALLEILCTRRRLPVAALKDHLDETGVDLLLRLHSEGALHFASTVENGDA